MNTHPPFEVIPLGVGNFFSTRRFCSSLLLLAGDKTLLVDCPEPFFRMCSLASRKSGRAIDPADIEHILITHMHGDHCHGLEGFGFWKKFYLGRKTGATIHTTHSVAGVLWGKLAPSMGRASIPSIGMDDEYQLADYFKVAPFEFGEKLKICGIEFETRRTLHTVPCFGFRASFGGRLLGYSCDTMFDPELIEFLAPCDLIFHECDRGLHTPLEKLEALPRAIRTKMRLIHLNDEFKGSGLIRAAQEGKVYRV